MSYPHSNTVRTALVVALCVSVLFAPAIVGGLFAVVLTARWRAWEVIAAGVLYDFLWLPTSVTFTSLDSFPFATCIALFLVIGFEPLRKRLLVGPMIE